MPTWQMVRGSFVRLVHASVPVWPVIPARAPLGLERVPGLDDDPAHRAGVLAVGPDTETAVSLLVALEEAAEAELRAAALG